MDKDFGAVFLYGAGLGNFIWQDLKPFIEFPALFIEYPNRELGEKMNYDLEFDEYIKPAIDQIQKWNKDKLVFVTHSIGGCVGLKLSDYFKERTIGFIGIGSAIPESGKSFVSCLPFPKNLLTPILLSLFGTKPPNKSIEKQLCNDLSPSQTSEVVNRFTPEAKSLYTTKITYHNLPENTLYIKLSKDAGGIEIQDKMIQNLKAEKVETIDSGHLPMMSRPEKLSGILNGFMNQFG